MSKYETRPPRYSVATHCDNCGDEQRSEIPVGMAVTDKKCEVCGCAKLHRKSLSQGYRVER